MLDDQKIIAQRDLSDALEVARQTPEQLRHDFGVQFEAKAPIRNIVFSAMGGSALQAELASTTLDLPVPFVISKQYDIPAFVDESTLFIAASYSGNTEETLQSLENARARGAQLVIMSGGGKLEEIANQHGDQFVKIPKAAQPRMAVFYGYRALVELFVALEFLERTVLDKLETAASNLESVAETWQKTSPLEENHAKQLALQLVGKTPIVYASAAMASAAYKWKISFNESSKNTAWSGTLPEFNHNEFIGWTGHPIEKPFAVIDLRSSLDHPRVQKRFELTDRLLSGQRPKAISVEVYGESRIEQLLYLVLFGDFVSLYLGILNGVDPTPVALVERLKKELG